MTNATTPQVYGEFGQALGQAERTLSAILRAHLAERGIEPETWYALKLLGAAGQAGMSRDEVARMLITPATFGAAAADAVLRRLEADGRAESRDGLLTLTPSGEAEYADLRAYVAGPSAALLGQVDVADLETTVRTLRAITALATAA